jgi:iron complex outermembrane receptor protein
VLRRLPAGSLLSLGVILASAAPAAASDDDAGSPRDTVYALPGVEVHERRPEWARELRTASGAASVLRVEEAPSRWTTAADLLSMAPGVRVRRFGGLGAYSAVSVRGSSPSQVTYYLDGVPLSHAQYGVVSASDLPVAALERIEVYRSGAPAAFSDAGGGVVHLVSRAAERTEARVLVSYADFDTRQLRLWGSAAGEALAGFLSYDYRTSAGAYDFLDDNSTPLNLDDDTTAVRRNNDYAQHAATAKCDLALGRSLGGAGARPFGTAGRLTLGLDGLWKEAGLPGLSSFQADQASFETRRGVASTTWESPPWWRGTLDLRTQLYGTASRDRFTDLERELGRGRRDLLGETWAFGVRQEAWLARGPLRQEIGAVGEAKREEYQATNLLQGETPGPMSRRGTLAWGGEWRLEPAPRWLRVVADLRSETAHDEFPEGPAYPGALASPAVDTSRSVTRLHGGLVATGPHGVTLRANASSTERLPTLFELYGDRGTVVGNRSLVPERLDSRDVGLAWQAGQPSSGALRLALTAYRTDATDLILFLQNSQQTSVAQNISAALLQGIETELGLARGPFRFSGAWTWQDTSDRSAAPHWNGRDLPGRPPHDVDTRLEVRASRWRAFHEYQFISRSYLDRANTQPIPDRHLHNLGLGVRLFSGRAEISLEARNVTDERVQDVAAYPLPGRALGMALEARL